MKRDLKRLDYRLRVMTTMGKSYIVRKNGDVSYISGAETPLALSNLYGPKAAETRFALEDCRDGSAAAQAAREALKGTPHENATIMVIP